MAETSISWTDYTFNPWIGCAKVSPGCKNCYAEAMTKRRTNWGVIWGVNGTRKKTSLANWRKPLAWNREAKASGRRGRVFCSSLADVFEDRPDLAPMRSGLFSLIKVTPDLDWLLLTKRPENIEKMLPPDWHDGWPNVWLGASAEDQIRYDERIDTLLKTKAKVHFISAEPLLGEIRIRHSPKDGLNWIIVGGESGPNFRRMDLRWAKKLRDDARKRGVIFFFKQHSAFQPKKVGDLLDGKRHRNWPSVAMRRPRGRPKVSSLSRSAQIYQAQRRFRARNALVPLNKDIIARVDAVVGRKQRADFVETAIDLALKIRSPQSQSGDV